MILGLLCGLIAWAFYRLGYRHGRQDTRLGLVKPIRRRSA